MYLNTVVIYNVIVPLLTGLFLIFYFLYFVLSNRSHVVSYRFFVLFLFCFGLFLMGRALQVTAGHHPLPLIIVNIRMFFFCSVVVPFAMLTTGIFKKKKIRYREIILICACVTLGLVYDVFNFLGTTGSYVIFKDAGITLYDTLTPTMMAPFYAREVTIAVQVITGMLLFLFSLGRLIKLKKSIKMPNFIKDKNFLINIGIIIFALSFIIGSLMKQWWIFYVTSFITAIFIGASVLMDVKEINNYHDKLIPLIKDYIIHNFAFKDFSKIKDMLKLLGKNTSMDTFVAVKLVKTADDISKDLVNYDSIVSIINKQINTILDEKNYVILPITNDRIGIILCILNEPDNEKKTFLELMENIHDEILDKTKCISKIGVGRSYHNIEELTVSYLEAINAQEYAEQHKSGDIIHVENINVKKENQNIFPVKEKEILLSSVKLGDLKESENNLSKFIIKFKSFIEQNPDILKARLYGLIVSLIESAVLGGGEESKQTDLVNKYFYEISMIKDINEIDALLYKIVREITGNIGYAYEKRSKSLIENAKRYIEKNYKQQLSYKDVAKEIFISPSYFLNLFKKETGLTFVDFLTNVRINKAKGLLRLTELNITEIAYEVGYNNSNYFSNIFKKAVGVSAKEYRKR